MARTFLTPIALPGDPTSALQAATKQYVDTNDALKLNVTDKRALIDQVNTHDPSLSTWRTALANRATAPADILIIGDSISEGMGASTLANRWIEQFQAMMRAAYPTTGVNGGDGYRPAQYISTSFPNGWSYGGNISGDGTFGLGHKSAVLSAPDGQLSRSVYGTSVTIAYSTNTSFGQFQVFVDGSSTASATVNTASGASGTTRDGGRTTITFGSRGTHTVLIKWASGGTGGSVIINGLFVRDQDENAGVRVTDSAQHGSSSANWSTSTNSNAYVLADDITAMQPDLVIIELGANDMIQGLSSTAFGTNIQNIITQVRNACTVAPSIVLVAAYQLAANYVEPWVNYVEQMRVIATNDVNVSLLDLSLRMPPASVSTYGFIYSDGVHPSDAGMNFIARRVFEYLTPPINYVQDGVAPSDGQVLTYSAARGAYLPKAAGGGGSSLLVPTTKTANYTASPGDLILADASGGAFTITLPTTSAGAVIEIKKIDSSANAVTLVAASGNTLGSLGATSFPIRLTDQAIILQANGTNWIAQAGYNSLQQLDARYLPVTTGIFNVLSYGAKGDGTTDDTAAINAAIAAALAVGGRVLFPPGTYGTSSVIDVPENVTLEGVHGDTIPYSTSPPSPCQIKPLSSHTGTAIIRMRGKTETGRTYDHVGARLLNLMLDGTNTPSGTKGVQVAALVREARFEYVTTHNTKDTGFWFGAGATATTTMPQSCRLIGCLSNNSGNNGYTFTNVPDTTLIDCNSLGATNQGFYFAGFMNGQVANCRSEWSGQQGYYITSGYWGTGQGSGGANFLSCTSDRSNANGVYIDSQGSAPLQFTNCTFRRDGRNNGTGGNNYAAFFVSTSCTQPIIIDNIHIFPGVDDGGGGTNSPQIGLSSTGTTICVVSSGSIHANTTAVATGLGTILDSSVPLAVGTTSSFTRTPGVPAVSSSLRGPIGGVQYPVYSSTIQVDASVSSEWRYTATSSPTITVPLNYTDGQRLLFCITASGANRTITLDTSIEIGANVSSRTITCTNGATAYIGLHCRNGTWRALAVDSI